MLKEQVSKHCPLFCLDDSLLLVGDNCDRN